jgi:pimeloyl-ACP methyl ester carboxylesterase
VIKQGDRFVPELIAKDYLLKRSRSSGECPLFFTSGQRPLYGVFHPAGSAGLNDYVLVVSHAIGTEHMLTQRIEALAARSAAATGIPAFRYNARAHGDSAGEARDLTFEDLVEDACAAADMARQLSGASRIIWLGVRLGCAVVAAAIRRRPDTCALALWAPVHRGEDYVRSMLRATFFTHVAKGGRPNLTIEGMLEQLEHKGQFPVVAGYVYRAFYRSVKEVDLCETLDWGGQTLIAQVQRRSAPSADNERLQAEIQSRGGKVTSICIREEPPWTMLTVVKPQWISDELLSATKEWLNGLE